MERPSQMKKTSNKSGMGQKGQPLTFEFCLDVQRGTIIRFTYTARGEW